MMKHEFDTLAEITTAPEAYERIELVYMNSDKFQTKQEIADFYKEHDMNGIEGVYKELVESQSRTAEFQEFILNLSIFASKYVDKIRKQLAAEAHTIYQNKTVVALLKQFVIRKGEEQSRLYQDFLYAAQYTHGEVSLSSNCLTNASHYETVLADLLIKK